MFVLTDVICIENTLKGNQNCTPYPIVHINRVRVNEVLLYVGTSLKKMHMWQSGLNMDVIRITCNIFEVGNYHISSHFAKVLFLTCVSAT